MDTGYIVQTLRQIATERGWEIAINVTPPARSRGFVVFSSNCPAKIRTAEPDNTDAVVLPLDFPRQIYAGEKLSPGIGGVAPDIANIRLGDMPFPTESVSAPKVCDPSLGWPSSDGERFWHKPPDGFREGFREGVKTFWLWLRGRLLRHG